MRDRVVARIADIIKAVVGLMSVRAIEAALRGSATIEPNEVELAVDGYATAASCVLHVQLLVLFVDLACVPRLCHSAHASGTPAAPVGVAVGTSDGGTIAAATTIITTTLATATTGAGAGAAASTAATAAATATITILAASAAASAAAAGGGARPRGGPIPAERY
jgi:hypothetical protein